MAPRMYKRLAVSLGGAPIVALVAMDDKSVAKLGYWVSWDRSYYARALRFLAGAKARVGALKVGGRDPRRDEALPRYEAVVALYRRHEFEAAEKAFEAVLERSPPVDGPSAVYLERCRELKDDRRPATGTACT